MRFKSVLQMNGPNYFKYQNNPNPLHNIKRYNIKPQNNWQT